MTKLTFNHSFEMNQNGCPVMELPKSGRIEVTTFNGGVEITGNKDGLIALAKRLIEVANVDQSGYHCHCDVMESEGFHIHPKGLDLVVGIE